MHIEAEGGVESARVGMLGILSDMGVSQVNAIKLGPDRIVFTLCECRFRHTRERCDQLVTTITAVPSKIPKSPSVNYIHVDHHVGMVALRAALAPAHQPSRGAAKQHRVFHGY